ncbi:DUF1307 domain-containing protein [bacterium]|nr:DUF1307 domain-containing protein [bacterium]
MKKRYLFLAIVMVGVFLITGCSSNSKDIVNNGNVMTCTRSVNKNGMKTSLNYKVYYEGDDVTRIKSEESIQMENNQSLKGYKEQIEKVYEPYKNVKFYNYNIAIRGNKLISKVDINYSKIDTNKLIEIDKANSQIITDGKIKVSSVKSLYEKLGATCK